MKQLHAVSGLSVKFCLAFSRFRKVDLHIQERNSFFGVGECVFNRKADCFHKCHQGFELCVRTKADNKNVVNESFPKVNQVKECQDGSTFLFAPEKFGIENSHPCSHGGAEGLVDVCIHEIEGAMFKNKIKDVGEMGSLWVGDAFISP